MKRLHWYDHLNVNIFWLGLNIRNNAIGTFFMPYLVSIFVDQNIQNTALGEMRTAGLIIAMLVQPAMGLLSDRSTSRFGRRRPFIFLGVLFDLVFLGFIAFSFNYWSLLVAILFIQFSANMSHGALQGLIPDLVPENQRGVSSAVKAILELIPLILLGLTIGPLIAGGQFKLAVLVTGAGLLLTMLLTMVLVKETPQEKKPNIPLAPAMLRVLGMLGGILAGGVAGILAGGLAGGLLGLISWPIFGKEIALNVLVGFGGVVAMAVAVVAGVWGGTYATLGNEIRQHTSFSWWVVNRLMFFAAITSIQGFAPLFLAYTFKVTPEAAAQITGNLMMVVGAVTLLSAFPSGWLSDRFGQKRMTGLSGWVAAVGAVFLLLTIWQPSFAILYTAGVFLGLSAGLFTTTNWAMGTRLAPPGQAGRYLGISNLAGAGAGMIGTGIGGPIADYLNASFPGLGYFALFSAYGLLFILSVFSLKGIKETT
jgi:MFS family permease